MGLRSEAEKHQIDFGPIMLSLLQLELPIESDIKGKFSAEETNKVLTKIQSELKNTSYDNNGLDILRNSVKTINDYLANIPI